MSATAGDLGTRMAAIARGVEAELERLLPESAAPEARLYAAMRHAVLGGGKRVRPVLAVLSGELCGLDERPALRIGAAIECIHAYSLAHDDLPAMDDALERRGRPALHRAFDEATAILAGDALQAAAFEALAFIETVPAEARLELVAGLARAAGAGGMCGGQLIDLQAEEQGLADLAAIRHLQALKTGALITFACEAGAIAAGADAAARGALRDYGRALGSAFQIKDDLLDIGGDPALVGKDLGRDAAAGKATFVAACGAGGAEALLQEEVGRARAALQPFGDRGAHLVELARFVAGRAA